MAISLRDEVVSSYWLSLKLIKRYCCDWSCSRKLVLVWLAVAAACWFTSSIDPPALARKFSAATRGEAVALRAMRAGESSFSSYFAALWLGRVRPPVLELWGESLKIFRSLDS